MRNNYNQQKLILFAKRYLKYILIMIIFLQFIFTIWYFKSSTGNEDCLHDLSRSTYHSGLTLYPATKWWESKEKMEERLSLILQNYFPIYSQVDTQQRAKYLVNQ